LGAGRQVLGGTDGDAEIEMGLVRGIALARERGALDVAGEARTGGHGAAAAGDGPASLSAERGDASRVGRIERTAAVGRRIVTVPDFVEIRERMLVELGAVGAQLLDGPQQRLVELARRVGIENRLVIERVAAD